MASILLSVSFKRAFSFALFLLLPPPPSKPPEERGTRTETLYISSQGLEKKNAFVFIFDQNHHP
jgi:hypothetical protein